MVKMQIELYWNNKIKAAYKFCATKENRRKNIIKFLAIPWKINNIVGKNKFLSTI